MFYLVRQWWSTYYSFWSSTCVDVLSDPCCHVFNVFHAKRCPIRHYPQWFCKSLFFIYVIFALCITYVGVQPDFHSRRYIFFVSCAVWNLFSSSWIYLKYYWIDVNQHSINQPIYIIWWLRDHAILLSQSYCEIKILNNYDSKEEIRSSA